MSRIVLALFGLSALLAVLLVSEWLPDAAPTGPVMAARTPATGKAPPAAEIDTSEFVSTVLARPLFSPSRRPPPPDGKGNDAGPGLPRLAGIMVSPAGRRAIFAPTGGKTMTLAEGASVGDGVIRAIRPDAVVIGNPDAHTRDVVLTPAYDRDRVVPKAPIGAQPAPPFTPRVLGGPGGFQPGQPTAETGNDDDDTTATNPDDPSPPPPGPPRPLPLFRPPGLPGQPVLPRRE